ncbi:MAG TPA: hypothetical protein VLA15_03835, partial [Desulfurivibrionaceae bacterium]|nr:hypothetical protein [Desulfurivibrionaceae bacterium]
MSEQDEGDTWRFATIRITAEELRISFAGDWSLNQNLPNAEALTAELGGEIRRLGFATDDLGAWDTGFLAILTSFFKYCAAKGITVDQNGLPKGVQRLLAMATAVPEQEVVGRDHGQRPLLQRVGAFAINYLQGLPDMLHFLGEITIAMGRLVTGRAQFQIRDLWWEIQEVGPKALVIVSVICFLV